MTSRPGLGGRFSENLGQPGFFRFRRLPCRTWPPIVLEKIVFSLPSAMLDHLADDPLILGSHRLTSRLIVGTGKYASYDLMREALAASGADCITVAVRRERLIDAAGVNL